MPCFKGTYLESDSTDKKTDDVELNVFELMVMGLKLGISYTDFYEMNLVTLINILTTAYKPKKRKPTQEEIDLIT